MTDEKLDRASEIAKAHLILYGRAIRPQQVEDLAQAIRAYGAERVQAIEKVRECADRHLAEADDVIERVAKESHYFRNAVNRAALPSLPDHVASIVVRAEAAEALLEQYRAATWLAGEDIGFWPQGGERFALMCSDTFGYACADCEEIRLEDAPHAKAVYEAEGWPGIVRWIAEVRGTRPLKEVEKSMTDYDRRVREAHIAGRREMREELRNLALSIGPLRAHEIEGHPDAALPEAK